MLYKYTNIGFSDITRVKLGVSKTIVKLRFFINIINKEFGI